MLGQRAGCLHWQSRIASQENWHSWAQSLVRGGTGEDEVRRLFQEQASSPVSLSGHCFFSVASLPGC